MTDTLLGEFEAWLRNHPERYSTTEVHMLIFEGLKKLEELKKKYKVG